MSWHVLPWWQCGTALVSLAALNSLPHTKLTLLHELIAVFTSPMASSKTANETSANYERDDTALDFLYPNREQVMCDILVALAAIATLYAAIHLVRSLTLRHTLLVAEASTPLNISLEFGSAVIMSPIFFALYLHSAFQMYGSLEDRWAATTRNAYTVIVLHAATDILGSILFVALQKKDVLLYVHHALTVSIYCQAALHGRGHFYTCIASTVELTNVFLFIITCGPSIGIKSGSPIHTASGALLWLAFTLFRMLVLPAALAFYVLDVHTAPSATLLTLPPLLRAVQWPGGVIVFLLSAFWYAKITKGIAKALNLLPRVKGSKDS